MKKMEYIKLILVLLMLVVNGCGSSKKYGQEISNRQTTSIKDILAEPKTYSGRLVTIEGKIDSECKTGCWFYVKVAEGNISIYVDVGDSGFAIPQYTGKKILVEGTVIVKETGSMIQGRGVEII
jgi:starvation-inducible outer membrane lipoprotein